MDVPEIRKEFSVRYYLWAKVEAEREVSEQFPSLRSFRGGMTWKMFQFITELSRNDQYTYVRALQKHYHAAAAKVLGESLSKDEEILLARGWSFNLGSLGRELEARIRRDAGEPMRFASKRTLRTLMAAKFREAFGNRCLGPDRAEVGQDLGFDMQFSSWIVRTSFWFGRERSVMSYRHAIVSEERIVNPRHPDITGPAVVLTLVCWIGLLPMEWEYIYDDEVEPACDAVIKQCRQVFSEMPRLLDGLTLDNRASRDVNSTPSP